jgi:hypothetical protein
MFGLMRPASCHRKVPESRYRRRLHYCGTCKAIGKLYGHRYRLLLNHDTVFLAEMLSVWTGEDATLSEWDAALQSHNCLRTPERTPFCLEYAATATLLLGDFKLLDHAADSRNRFWRWLHRRCSPEFRAASERLERWGFPTAELRDILASQQDRERRGWSDDDVPSDRMKFLAEPTARATALFFRHGARLTGRREDAAAEMGNAFGTLVYVLDAVSDFEKDAREGSFNAVRACLPESGPALSAPRRQWAIECARQAAAGMEAALASMDLPSGVQAEFARRLHSAFQRKTGMALRVLTEETCSHESYWKRFAKAVLMPWRAEARNEFLGRGR